MSFEQAVADLEATNANLVQEVVRVRDAAMGLNRIYPNTSTGLANVNDGQYFAVPGTGNTYMTLYRRNGTSANQISQYPSQAAVDGVVNLLGDAAYKDVMSSLTDTTAGRLMPVGAFGWGSDGAVAVAAFQDMDDPSIPSGVFRIEDGNANMPPDARSGVLIQTRRLDASSFLRVHQSFYDRSRRSWERFNVGGVWDSWREFYTTGNILGTVSQSGGVPTGAIIEYGSNANGSWVTFAGGFTVCSRDIGAIELADTSGTRDYLLPIDSLREPHSAYMSMRRGNSPDIWYAFNQTILMVSTNNWRLSLTDGSISSVTSFPITLVATGYRNDL